MVAGTLLALGSMLREWGIPVEVAVKGLRLAYRMDKAKERRRGRRKQS